MTGTITLSDGGQNYVEFDIVDNVIQEVRPAMLAGWKGTPEENGMIYCCFCGKKIKEFAKEGEKC